MEIVQIVLGIVIGFVLMYFILRPKLTSTKRRNDQIEEENQKLLDKKAQLEQDIMELNTKFLSDNNLVNETLIKLKGLKVEVEQTERHRDIMREQVDKDNDLIYQKSYDLMQEHLSQAAEKEAQKFQQAQKDAEMEYLKALEEIALETAAALTSKREEVRAAEQQLATLKAKADAAIAAAKREEEKLLEIDKYKILVSELDLLEINRLREIAPYFRNARAIYKIIWESYYRNLTTDLVNRVIGSGTHTGIYKITNTLNQRIYIGQAVDLATRWKDHIKAGLGIDTPNNMLYKAMLKDGVENFTFEVLEECERSALNDRETYYIAFYKSQEWGYNMSRGGARK